MKHYDDITAYFSSEVIHSVRDLGQEGYAAQLVGTKNVVYPPYILRGGVTFALPSPRQVPLDLGGEAMLIGPRRAADTSIVENGRSFDLDPYVSLNLSLATRALYLVPEQESRVAIRAKNVLGATGPDPGPSGFEYPVAPREIFLELQHVY